MLRPEAEAALAGVEHILHAGDIGHPEIVPRLARIAPVTAVRGNVDTAPWAAAFPERARLVLAGRSVLMVHAWAEVGEERADVVVFGHSHRAEVRRNGDRLWLNPGSAGPRRFRLPVTLALLWLGDEVRAEVVAVVG